MEKTDHSVDPNKQTEVEDMLFGLGAGTACAFGIGLMARLPLMVNVVGSLASIGMLVTGMAIAVGIKKLFEDEPLIGAGS
jgi:hypothetical protein